MKTVICLLGLIAISLAADTVPNCPKVICSTLDDDVCASATKGDTDYEVKIQACGSKKYCDITYAGLLDLGNEETAKCEDLEEEEEKEEEEEEITGLMPGSSCSGNKQCAFGTCTGSICEGVAKGDECKAYSEATTDEYDKLCGADLYCSSDACAEGKETGETCTADYECAGRDVCVTNNDEEEEKTVCTKPASIAKGDTCTSSYYCVDDYYCDSGECKEADTYSSGGYGEACSVDDDCGDATCLCSQANTEGKGNCGLLDDETIGQDALNKNRAAFADSDFGCPLYWTKTTNGGCADTYDLVTYETFSTGSCYGDFVYNGGTLPVIKSSSSAFGLYASVLGFIAYLLA